MWHTPSSFLFLAPWCIFPEGLRELCSWRDLRQSLGKGDIGAGIYWDPSGGPCPDSTLLSRLLCEDARSLESL